MAKSKKVVVVTQIMFPFDLLLYCLMFIFHSLQSICVLNLNPIPKIKYVKVKQLEDGYVRFVALSFFFLFTKFCPF